MADPLTIVAGRCHVEFSADHDPSETVGDVLVVCKPDNTVLVHDAAGYQPVAWLTRPGSLAVTDDRIDAVDGDRHLGIGIREEHGRATFDVQRAGDPVGTCPACLVPLVRSGGAVGCLECGERYPIPGDAAVTDVDCDSCGLPRISVRRGRQLSVCLDRACESIDGRVREAFDREWDCPVCGADLRVLRRGGLLLGCDAYPDCETSFSFPAGVVTGACECGLPVFETATGHRCLDSGCASA